MVAKLFNLFFILTSLILAVVAFLLNAYSIHLMRYDLKAAFVIFILGYLTLWVAILMAFNWVSWR